MSNIMSDFNIRRKISKGRSLISIKCSYCNTLNNVQVLNKLNKQKITIFKCKNCGKADSVGDVFNLNTGKSLNNLLDKRHNSVTYDEYNWSQDYDNI